MWTCFAFDLEDEAVKLFWIKILQENVSTMRGHRGFLVEVQSHAGCFLRGQLIRLNPI